MGRIKRTYTLHKSNDDYVFFHGEVIRLSSINIYKAVDEFGVRYRTFNNPETVAKCTKLLKKYLTNHLDLTEIQNAEENKKQ